MYSLPARSAARTIRRASAMLPAIGFSPITWHPAASAAHVTAQCASGTVRSTTKSGRCFRSVAFRSSDASASSSYWAICFRAASMFRSTTATTRTFSRRNGGNHALEIPPAPTTTARSFAMVKFPAPGLVATGNTSSEVYPRRQKNSSANVQFSCNIIRSLRPVLR
ncbi:MAG TPA: hypothetical protein DCX07_15125 [Phycisphaerales bacterium]|nr:hypothetical protein [Phycisphaerales bacterium]